MYTNAVMRQPVTVKYQDSEGNQLAEPTVLSGKVGLPYASEAKEIPGWYVVEIPDNASGIFSEEAQEVVYVHSVLHKNNEKERMILEGLCQLRRRNVGTIQCW